MCKCINIKVGSYGNQIELPRPKHMGEGDTICVDVCLKDEILHLWSLGITTTGCCCGHNKVPPYIGVSEDDIYSMKHWGYDVQYNPLRPEAQDSFKPKTI